MYRNLVRLRSKHRPPEKAPGAENIEVAVGPLTVGGFYPLRLGDDPAVIDEKPGLGCASFGVGIGAVIGLVRISFRDI